MLYFSSCTTTMYVPNTLNTPLLKERGEVKINVDANNLQVAAGISNHLGIMVNGFYKTYTGNNDYEHKGGLLEAGIGYFKPMENNPLVFETFAGVGIGKVSKTQQFTNGSESYTASFNSDATKFFLQPEIGYAGKIVDVAFSPRFSFVKYDNFRSSNYTEEQLKEDYLDNGRLTSPLFVFAEPTITARVGYKWIKLQAQYGLITNIGEGKIKSPDNFSSLGLVIDIAKWYNN